MTDARQYSASMLWSPMLVEHWKGVATSIVNTLPLNDTPKSSPPSWEKAIVARNNLRARIMASIYAAIRRNSGGNGERASRVDTEDAIALDAILTFEVADDGKLVVLLKKKRSLVRGLTQSSAFQGAQSRRPLSSFCRARVTVRDGATAIYNATSLPFFFGAQ